MNEIFLPSVATASSGPQAEVIRLHEKAGLPLPGIIRLFAYKPEFAKPLGQMMHVLMRGPSPLSAGMRELIAAFVSRRNQCVF